MWIVMAGPARTAAPAAVAVRWQEPVASAPQPTGSSAGAVTAAPYSAINPTDSALRTGRSIYPPRLK